MNRVAALALLSLTLLACGTSVQSDSSLPDASNDASADVPRDIASRFEPTPSTAPFGLVSIEANGAGRASLEMGNFDPLLDPMTSIEDIRASGPNCVQLVEVADTFKPLVNVFSVSYQGLPEVTGQGIAAVPPNSWTIGPYDAGTWFRVTGFKPAWPRPFVTEIAAPPALPARVTLPTLEPGDPPTVNRNAPLEARWDPQGASEDTHIEVTLTFIRGSDVFNRLVCHAPVRRGVLSINLWEHEPWFGQAGGLLRFLIEMSYRVVQRRIERTPDGAPVLVQSRRYLDGRVFRFM
jgi:hypothetical protein